MTDQVASSESRPRLPERLTATFASLSEADADGLTQAECLEVVGLLEATKGAAAALQARATPTPGRPGSGTRSRGGRSPADGARPAPRSGWPAGARPRRPIDTCGSPVP